MSLADNLKERFKSTGDKVIERVRESNAYAQAADRYENLNPASQKLAKLFGVIVVLMLVLFIPLSNLSSSFSSISMFEDERELIRELFRTYRDSSSTQNVPVPPQPESLISMVNSVLERAQLLPEQNLGATPASFEGRLIPNNLVSNVLSVKLAKLNLKQIVDIGGSLIGLSESVKMKDMSIVANATDTRYYDVTFKLYTLKVPEPTPEPPPEPEKKPTGKNKGSNSNSNNGKKDEDTKE